MALDVHELTNPYAKIWKLFTTYKHQAQTRDLGAIA